MATAAMLGNGIRMQVQMDWGGKIGMRNDVDITGTVCATVDG